MSLTTRRAMPDDAEEMAALINEIIRIGGTTAYEVPFDREAMDHEFISSPDVIACTLAENEGVLLGFQVLLSALEGEPMPPGWGAIGTYARVGHTGVGIGRALFEETKHAARAAGLRTIDATIRADNVGGLRFYGRLGFVDYNRKVGVPLNDGTLVDRVQKRFDLT
jgi:ribosomal protein S18 acetylase RimI-like enzyme